MSRKVTAVRTAARWMKVAAASAAAVLGGCAGTDDAAETPVDGATGAVPAVVPMEIASLSEATDKVLYNSRQWRTLSAKVRVEVRSPGVRVPGVEDDAAANTVVFDGGNLYMFKRVATDTGDLAGVPLMMIHVRVGDDLLMVSDGRDYYLKAPRFRQEYAGKARELPSSGLSPERLPVIPLLPQDVIDALEPGGTLWNYVPVLKQDRPALELLSLDLVEPAPGASGAREGARMRIASNLMLDRQTYEPVAMYINGAADAPRAIIRYEQMGDPKNYGDDGKVSSGPVARIPFQFWIGYPDASAVARFTLTDVKTNVPVPPALFRLEDAR